MFKILSPKSAIFSFVVFLSFYNGYASNSSSDVADKLPFRFRGNMGQWEEKIQYGAWSGSANVYFMNQGLSITHSRLNDQKKTNYLTWNLLFQNADQVTPVCSDARATTIQYTNAKGSIKIDREYAMLTYHGLYPSIDLQYYGYENTLKYDYILHPGANAANIRMQAQGIDHLEIVDGELFIHHSWGTVKENKPYSYQMINGKQQEVQVRFKLYDAQTYGFEVTGPYDPSANLIIDPVQLLWGTYVGSANANSGGYMFDIATDSEMNIYGTGYYKASFPVTPGAFDTSFNGGDIDGSNGDVYVFKLSSDGTSLIYATYLGGLRDEEGKAIYVTKGGRVYVAGITNSSDFPVTANAKQKLRYGLTDGFITCLDTYQGNLLYSTYMGGIANDQFNDLKVDKNGSVWVCGETQSTDFPTTLNAIHTSYYGGAFDGIITKMDANLSTVQYSSYVGGAGDDRLYALSSFANTITYTGYSNSSNFKTTPGAYQTVNKGFLDVVVGRLEASTYNLIYSTYIGGTYDEIGSDIDCNESGAAFLTGYTMSADYPNTASVPLKGLKDVFVTCLSADGSSLIYSRLVGGRDLDEGTSIIVNIQNQAFVAGNSKSADFPVNKTNTRDKEFQVFLFSVDYTGNFLGWSLMVGGSKNDYETPRIAFSSREYICEVVVGFTTHSTDLPTTPEAYQPNKLNGGDANDQPAIFKYYFGPALPFCDKNIVPENPVSYKPYLDYKCKPCRENCNNDSLTECPGIIPLKLPYRPVDTSYFLPWKYNKLVKDSIFTDSVLKFYFKGKQDSVTIQISDGCNKINKVFTITQPDVSLGISSSAAYLCSGSDSVTLTANVKNYKKVLWSTGETTLSIKVKNTGWYKVKAYEGICGETDYDSIEVQRSGPPSNPFSASQTVSYCFPGSYDLNATLPGDTIKTVYTWTPGNVTTDILTITKGGTYCISKSNACGSVSGCITVVELTKPVFDLGKDTVLCQGQTLTLSVPTQYANLPITWSTGAHTPSIVAQPGSLYWVEVINSCGTTRDEINVGRSDNIPTVNLGADKVICSASGFPLTLDAVFANATYHWSTGETSRSIQITKGGKYSVLAANGCGFDEDTIDIVANPMLSLSLGPDVRGCAPISFTLDAGDAGAGTTYAWSNGASTRTITVNQTGIYSVTETNACGTASTSVKVIVDNGLPSFSLGNDTSICPGSIYRLGTSTSATAYLWMNDSTTSHIPVTKAGLYWLQLTNTCGLKRDSINISIQTPLYTALPADTSMCEPAILFLEVPQQNASYVWSTGSTARSIIVTNAGTYNITLTNACQQVSQNVKVEFVTTAPSVNLGPDLTRCGPGISEVLDAGANIYKYLWNDGSTGRTITAVSPGLYSVKVSNGCGFDTDSLIIIGDPVKTLLPDVSICNVVPVILDAGNVGSGYLWMPGNQTTQTITTSQTGQYIVVVSNACGIIKDTVNVSLETKPPVFDLGPDTRICSPSSKTLSVNIPGVAYLWSTGSTQSSISVSQAGLYSVQVTNACGTTKDSVAIAVDAGLPIVNLGLDRAMCNPFALSLDAGNPGAKYEWTPGLSHARRLTVFSTGTYKVVVTNGCGTGTDEVNVNGYNLPVLSIKDTSNCNTPVTFDATNPPADYFWSPTGSTAPTLTVNNSGKYRIDLIHPCGIFSDSSDVIINKTIPDIQLGKDTLLCTPYGFDLNAGTYEGGSYEWLPDGSVAQTIHVNTAGRYILKATNYCGVNYDTLHVAANPIQVKALPDTIVCAYSELDIHTADISGYTYIWYASGKEKDTLSKAHEATVNPEYPFTKYVVKASDNICYNVDTLKVNVYKEVDPKIQVDNVDGYIPLEVHFQDANHSGTIYDWKFDDKGAGSTDPAPSYIFKEERYYEVSVLAKNAAGCEGRDTLQILAFTLFVPNLITPNGDAMNDRWDLTNLNPYLHVTIYNPWGDLVFEKQGYVDEWDGSGLPPGVYYYSVKDVKFGKTFKGWVQVFK